MGAGGAAAGSPGAAAAHDALDEAIQEAGGYREALEELPHVPALLLAIVDDQCLAPDAGALCFPVHDCGMHDAWTCLRSDRHPQCMPKGLSSPQGRRVSPCRRQTAPQPCHVWWRISNGDGRAPSAWRRAT